MTTRLLRERKVGKKPLIAETAEKSAENAERTRNGEFLLSVRSGQSFAVDKADNSRETPVNWFEGCWIALQPIKPV